MGSDLRATSGGGRATPRMSSSSIPTRADPEAVLSLVDRLVREPGVGIVGPKIVDEEGHLYQSQRRFVSVAISLAAAEFLPRFHPTTRWSLDVADPAAYEAPGSPDWVSGACFATRRGDPGRAWWLRRRFLPLRRGHGSREAGSRAGERDRLPSRTSSSSTQVEGRRRGRGWSRRWLAAGSGMRASTEDAMRCSASDLRRCCTT